MPQFIYCGIYFNSIYYIYSNITIQIVLFLKN